MLRLLCVTSYADRDLQGVACSSIACFLSNTAFDLSLMKSSLIGEQRLLLSLHGPYHAPHVFATFSRHAPCISQDVLSPMPVYGAPPVFF